MEVFSCVCEEKCTKQDYAYSLIKITIIINVVIITKIKTNKYLKNFYMIIEVNVYQMLFIICYIFGLVLLL